MIFTRLLTNQTYEKVISSMFLTKSHLIDTIANQNGFTRKKSTETVEKILEIIKSILASGEDVLISGFGKICVKQKTGAERKEL